jgi:hypothetical protein
MLSFVVMKPSTVNALAPLDFIVRVAIGLMLLVVAGQVHMALSGGPVAGSEKVVCVDAPVDAMTGTDGVHLATVRSPGSGDVLKPGTDATATTVRLCDSSPSGWQHVWDGLARWSPLAYVAGFLFGAWRISRTARRKGLFSPDTALATLRLGLYVLLGAVAVWLTQMWAVNQLMLSMAHTHDTGTSFYFLHVSWAVLFAGFGLLTVGRVMARSVAMQREIDATI